MEISKAGISSCEVSATGWPVNGLKPCGNLSGPYVAGEGSGWAVGVLIGTGVCVKDSDVLVLLGLCVCVVVGSDPSELLQEMSNETIKTVKRNLRMM